MSDETSAASTIEFSEAEAEPIVADASAYEGVVEYPVVSEVEFSEAEAEPIEVPVRELEFSDEEAEPIVGSAYDPAVQYPVVSHLDFDEAEAEAIEVPVREIEFADDDVEPIIARSSYDAAAPYPDATLVEFGEEEVEPIVVPVREIEFPEEEADAIVARPGYGEVLRSPAVTRIEFGEHEVDPIIGSPYGATIDYRVRVGDPLSAPVDPGSGLTPAHRSLLSQPRIPADPVEPWDTEAAARAFLERKLSRKGVSGFLADYKDRWVRAHRALLKAAAAQFDIPDWVLAGVAWTEVAGDPPWFDEAAVKTRQFVIGDPNQTSFGPVQIQLRRAAKELGYDAAKLSAIQRRVLIWSLEDPQQNVFVVAAHLRRLQEITAPGTGGGQLSDDQVKLIGARYNRGYELSDETLRTTRTKLSYGEALLNKRDRITNLLNAP